MDEPIKVLRKWLKELDEKIENLTKQRELVQKWLDEAEQSFLTSELSKEKEKKITVKEIIKGYLEENQGKWMHITQIYEGIREKWNTTAKNPIATISTTLLRAISNNEPWIEKHPEKKGLYRCPSFLVIGENLSTTKELTTKENNKYINNGAPLPEMEDGED